MTECQAVHVNFVPISQPAGTNLDSLSATEKEGLVRAENFMATGRGYSVEHATKPSTIGLILNSNPISLLAWIGEKYLDWSDSDPDLDTILEAVTLYWFTESGCRGVYPYRQARTLRFLSFRVLALTIRNRNRQVLT